ncbi:glutamine amidotransferase [Giesbergeria sinuosa]
MHTMKPLLIVKTGSTFAELVPQMGDFEDWICRTTANIPRPVVTWDAQRQPSLPDPLAFAGMVITGSHAMVTDQAPWSEALVPWLRHVVALERPVLGICYGHQLLAHALGGEVSFHPAGTEIGTTSITTTAEAALDPLFGALPPSFAAHTVHSQSVVRLPKAAVLLAHNDFEPHHAFRVGACAWGVQFHPEFDAAAMQGYIRQMAAPLSAQGLDPVALWERVRPTPEAQALLTRFCQQLAAHSPCPGQPFSAATTPTGAGSV